MNIIYIDHYAGSHLHGMEYRPYFMAKNWVKQGHKVTIVASSYTHLRSFNPDMQGQKTMEEDIDGVHYFWIEGPIYEGNGLSRVRNMLSFIRRIPQYAKVIVGEDTPDVVIASSTYPLDIYPARNLAKKYNAMLIYEVHDLWPLSPMELGNIPPYHPYIMMMQAAENYCYKYSDYVVSILPNAKEHMIEHGMAPEKFIYIPNGIVKEDWENPKTKGVVPYKELLTEFKKDGYFLVGYAGSHGIANDLDSFIEAALKVKDRKVKFILVGQGPERDRLIQKIVDLDLSDTVEALTAIKREDIPMFLSQMDTLYIGLQRQPLFRFGISPNKLMDYMMAGKPIVFAIDAPNDLVADAGCGISVPPEDSTEIAKAVLELSRMDKETLDEMGQRGHEYILKNHEYSVLADRFLDVFQMPKQELGNKKVEEKKEDTSKEDKISEAEKKTDTPKEDNISEEKKTDTLKESKASEAEKKEEPKSDSKDTFTQTKAQGTLQSNKKKETMAEKARELKEEVENNELPPKVEKKIETEVVNTEKETSTKAAKSAPAKTKKPASEARNLFKNTEEVKSSELPSKEAKKIEAETVNTPKESSTKATKSPPAKTKKPASEIRNLFESTEEVENNELSLKETNKVETKETSTKPTKSASTKTKKPFSETKSLFENTEETEILKSTPKTNTKKSASTKKETKVAPVKEEAPVVVEKELPKKALKVTPKRRVDPKKPPRR